MEQVVYKYGLKFTDHQTLKLPRGFKILSIGIQNEQPFIWCLVDKNEKELVEHDFEIFGTGHNMSMEHIVKRNFIGTYFLQYGLVFHLFEHTGF